VSGGGAAAASGRLGSAGDRSDAASPARVLAIDVGAGTADILLTRPGQPLENAVKLVVPSRTQVVAAQIAQATARGQAIVLCGPTMGGGANGAAMKAHIAAGLPFAATAEAALSFADDLDRVRRLGLRVIDEPNLGDHDCISRPGAVTLRSGDLDPGALSAALALLGADPRCDAVAIAVQDHGFSPHGSNRVLRFALWEAAMAAGRRLPDLFYRAADIPPQLTRLRAAARLAAELADGAPVLAADTGPSALYGALPDGVDDALLVNVGNGHTICVVALDGRLAGVFEHHTGLLDGAGLEERLRRFLAGQLTSDAVRADRGHGAVLAARTASRDLLALPLIVTGPRRGLLAGSSLPLDCAAPHGDMMLTGCFGLLRAIRERDAGARTLA
jgi:uncharacterized protein (DUF1786 family)